MTVIKANRGDMLGYDENQSIPYIHFPFILEILCLNPT